MPTEILVLHQVSKQFFGITALDGVSFKLRAGEIHGLLGENGAGKSTLMKILDGALLPDGGDIILKGKPVQFLSPEDARQQGIAMVYQELNLLPHLSVAENIFISSLPRTRTGLIDWKQLYLSAKQSLERLGLRVTEADVKVRLESLSVAQQQIVAIARALSTNCQVLILDEPTSALPQHDVDNLFRVMRTLKNQGVSVVFISHRLQEVLEITDRITVLRNGRTVGTLETHEADEDTLAEMIAGRSIKEKYPKVQTSATDTLLELQSVCVKNKLDNVSFTMKKGEILGIVGLLGAGKTEIARAIFGVYGGNPGLMTGNILLEGKEMRIRSPEEAIDLGVGLVPENRSTEGLLLNQSIGFNTSLPALKSLSRAGFVRQGEEGSMVERLIQRLHIKCFSPAQLARSLSGGNQQKVVLAKWLMNRARLVILDEPTRGIDVGAKVEVYNLINDLVQQGVGVLILSSEVPEIHGMADRILVLNRGRIIERFRRGEVDEQELQRLVM